MIKTDELREFRPVVRYIIGQGLSSIGKSKQKLEEEQNYYNCIIDILDDIISYDN